MANIHSLSGYIRALLLHAVPAVAFVALTRGMTVVLLVGHQQTVWLCCEALRAAALAYRYSYASTTALVL